MAPDLTPWRLELACSNVRALELAEPGELATLPNPLRLALGRGLKDKLEVHHMARVIDAAAELARRHPSGPGTLAVWSDAAGGVFAQVVMMRPPSAAPPPLVTKNKHARLRAEAMARRTPVEAPHRSGAVRIDPPPPASKGGGA